MTPPQVAPGIPYVQSFFVWMRRWNRNPLLDGVANFPSVLLRNKNLALKIKNVRLLLRLSLVHCIIIRKT